MCNQNIKDYNYIQEVYARLCDEIAHNAWNLYKGPPPYKGTEVLRSSDFMQGYSDGADACANAIRSIFK